MEYSCVYGKHTRDGLSEEKQTVSGYEIVCDLHMQIAECLESELDPVLGEDIPDFAQREGQCLPRRVYWAELVRAQEQGRMQQCLDSWERRSQTGRLSTKYPGWKEDPRPLITWPRRSHSASSPSSYAVESYTTYEDGRPYIAKSLSLEMLNASQAESGIERRPNSNHVRWDSADINSNYRACARESDDLGSTVVLHLALLLNVGRGSAH